MTALEEGAYPKVFANRTNLRRHHTDRATILTPRIDCRRLLPTLHNVNALRKNGGVAKLNFCFAGLLLIQLMFVV